MSTKENPPVIPGLKIPEFRAEKHREQLKLTLFNAKKSAAMTVWLVAIPCFFLFAVFMKQYFHYDLSLFGNIEEFIASIDRSSPIPMLSVILLVGLPLVGLAINTLSILHLEINRERKELIGTIKWRWINVAFILLCAGLLGIFMLYSIVENIRHLSPGALP